MFMNVGICGWMRTYIAVTPAECPIPTSWCPERCGEAMRPRNAAAYSVTAGMQSTTEAHGKGCEDAYRGLRCRVAASCH